MFSLQAAPAVCRTLGQRLRMLRLSRNLSQVELAAMAGASLSSVRRLEGGGQGSFEFVVTVAQALQVVEQLEHLFEVSTLSIAQVEAAARLQKRQRARKTGSRKGSSA